MEQFKSRVKVISTSDFHIERDIERAIDEGYVLQGSVQVVAAHQRCHWTYIATMVLKEELK